jgi:predicted ATPase/DNA-binding SARP family transcriptional activator/class 3 adenylate cyclase
VEFRTLGPLEVWADGRQLALGGAKQRRLLALLLLQAGRVVPAERLIEELWAGDPPKTAANALWVHVAGLRKALEPGRVAGSPGTVLLTRPHGYLLRVGPDELDIERFEGLLSKGRQALADHAPQQAATLLRQALALWRGPALADFALEPFAYGHIVRLEELRLVAVEERIEADLAAGRHQELVGELEALVAAHPLRERLRGQRMLALYRSGRQAEALEAYRQTRATLAEELGIDPSPPLQELHQAILSQDPTLRWLPPPVDDGSSAGDASSPAPQAAASPAPHRQPAPTRPPGGARKTVTVVCMGIAATTAGAELDPETLGAIQDRYLGDLCATVERHGGTVQQVAGETVTAVFGVPVVHENDAVRAVRAAIDGRAAVQQASQEVQRSWGVRLRFSAGIDTGQVVVGAHRQHRSPLSGAAPGLARRLEQAAAPDEIVLGATAYGLVRDAVRVESGPPLPIAQAGAQVPAWRLVAVRPGAPGRARRLDTPMVGRVGERQLLNDTFQRVVLGRACHLFTVLGAAGVGKSRLAQELLADAGQQATVLRGRCLDYGEGITFWALNEVVREAIGATEATSAAQVRAGLAALLEEEEHAELLTARLATMLGLAEATAPAEEIQWAVRRFLAALARRRPLIVVLDDLHWAESMLLDLVEHVAAWAHDAPILLCCIARPELLDARPGWGGGRVNATTILLEPLDAAQCATLIDHLLGRADLSAPVKLQLGEIAEGNPLFVEELVAMLIDQGVLTRADDHWAVTTELAEVPIPPTISLLLTARLDQLDTEERAILERASVIGKVFSRQALAELLPDSLRPEVATGLQHLVRKDLIRPDRPSSVRGETFRFRHLLIRDAAYQAIPKELRAQVHQRYAGWLELAAAEQPGEHQEFIGYHLEQAYRYLRELGPVDDHGRELANAAGRNLSAAGRRAFDRGDMPAAANLLGRAAALLPIAAVERLELLPDLGLALVDTGALQDADATLSQALQGAEANGDVRLAWRAALPRLGLRLNLRPEDTTTDEVRRQTERAIAELDRLGDDLGLARAWRLLCEVDNTWNQGAALAEAAEHAMGYARRAGDQRELSASVGFLALALTSGPAPVTEAIRRCTELLDRVQGNRAAKARLVQNLALLRASNKQFAAARELLASGRAIAEDLGLRWALAKLAWSAGDVERMAGDLAAAERELRAGYAIYQQMGEKSHLSSLAAYLADVLFLRDRDEEARRFTEISEAAAAPDDLLSQVRWRGTRAKILARQGRVLQAERMAKEAVKLAAQTDWLDQHADALLDLAEVVRRAGRSDEAGSLIEEALTLYRQKGNLVAAERARALLS